MPAPASDRPKVSVVLPAFNEEALIGDSLSRVVEYLRGLEQRFEWEVLVVDDGSSDDTGRVVLQTAGDESRVRLLTHPTNFGLGQALQTAFNAASGDYWITLDSDLSYDVTHIGRMLDVLTETPAKLVLASPYMSGSTTREVPGRRLLLSRIANAFLSRIAYADLSTFTCLARGYDSRFVRKLYLRSTGMSIMPEMVYKTRILGGAVTEIPATLDWSRQNAVGERRRSSMRVFPHVISTMLTGFMLRPVLFFFLPGLLLGLSGLYAGVWMFIHIADAYAVLTGMGTEKVTFTAALANAFQTSPHTFVIGLLLIMLSIQLVGLSFLALQSKRYFEELFGLGTSLRGRTGRTGDDVEE